MKETIAEYIVPVNQDGKDVMFDFLRATRLIRCKDCAYYSILGECYYLLTNFEMDNDDYCSNAMLKEEHEKEEDKRSD